jgi:hypothetical protein
MRSELVFTAVTYVPNRFLLTRLASTAIRKFHRPNTRIEETVNEVLERFALGSPIDGVPYTRNMHSFPGAVHDETHSPSRDLERSVA